MSATTLLQALVSGALVGCLYALIAVGFALVLSVSRALNLAHGELVVLGGYAGYAGWQAFGLDPLWLVPVGAAATLGLAPIWYGLIRRLPPPLELNSLVLTFGLALLLQNVMTTFWSGDYRLIVSRSFTTGLRLGPIVINHGRTVAAVIALVVVAALARAITRARWGRALRAVSLDRDGAALLAIDVDRATRRAFLLAGALAGGAGVLFATVHYLSPTAGIELTLLAIVLTLWAGDGTVGLLLVAGVVIGIGESLVEILAGPGWREPAIAAVLLGSLIARGGALTREPSHQ